MHTLRHFYFIFLLLLEPLPGSRAINMGRGGCIWVPEKPGAWPTVIFENNRNHKNGNYRYKARGSDSLASFHPTIYYYIVRELQTTTTLGRSYTHYTRMSFYDLAAVVTRNILKGTLRG